MTLTAPLLPLFTFPVRVYYEDTDAGGVVYYANYLKFLERARTEWLSHAGIELTALERDEGTLFAVRRVAVDYLSAARLGDRLSVSVEPTRVRAAALELAQKITLGEKLLIDAQVTLVTLSSRAWTPKRLPNVARSILSARYPHLFL